MRYLLDTNILLRLSQPNDPAYQSIIDSFALLQQPGIEFCVTMTKVKPRLAEHLVFVLVNQQMIEQHLPTFRPHRLLKGGLF